MNRIPDYEWQMLPENYANIIPCRGKEKSENSNERSFVAHQLLLTKSLTTSPEEKLSV